MPSIDAYLSGVRALLSDLASDAVLNSSLSHAAHKALGFEVVERIVVFRKAL